MKNEDLGWITPRLCRLLDERMAYRTCRPGLVGDIPNISRPPEWGYLWNPRSSILVDCWENKNGGCDVVVIRGLDPEHLAHGAHEMNVPWTELALDCPGCWTERIPFGLDAAIKRGSVDLPATGWVRAYPLLDGSSAPEGTTGLALALGMAQETDGQIMDELAALLDGGGDLKSLSGDQMGRAVEDATGRGLIALLGAWSDAMDKLTGADGGRVPRDEASIRLRGLDNALDGLGTTRGALGRACHAVALRDNGRFSPHLSDVAAAMGFHDLTEDEIARAVKRATGKTPEKLLRAWAEEGAWADEDRDEDGRGIDGLAAALDKVGCLPIELKGELNLAPLFSRPIEPLVDEPFVLLESCGGDALLKSPYPNDPLPFLVVHGYNPSTGEWAPGTCREDLLDALAVLRGARYINRRDPDLVCCAIWTRQDVIQGFFESAGRWPTEEEVDEVAGEISENMDDVVIGRGCELLCSVIDRIAAQTGSFYRMGVSDDPDIPKEADLPDVPRRSL